MEHNACPPSQLVLNGGLVGVRPRDEPGHPAVTGNRLLLPVVLVAVAVRFFLQDVPTAAGDARLELAGALTGVALGVAAGALMPVRRDAGGALVTPAGVGYALLWIASSVAGSPSPTPPPAGPRAVCGEFSDGPPDHRRRGMDGRAVLMALAMVLTRVAVTAAAPASSPAAVRWWRR